MKNALKNGTLDLPKNMKLPESVFEQIIANADRKPPVRDASRDVVVRLNKQVMLSRSSWSCGARSSKKPPTG